MMIYIEKNTPLGFDYRRVCHTVSSQQVSSPQTVLMSSPQRHR